MRWFLNTWSSGLQYQYKECQELLGLYQQYLSLQQGKLNQSIAQLSQEPAVGKVMAHGVRAQTVQRPVSIFAEAALFSIRQGN